MAKQVKYLVIFLLAVFVVPKAYQDIHILHHQVNYHAQEEAQSNLPIITTPGDGPCIICSFEFALFEVPQLIYFQIFVSLVLIHFSGWTSDKNYRFAGYHFSLRGPPYTN